MKKTKESALIHIPLQKVPYTSEKASMALTQLPENVTMNLAQQMGVPTQTDTHGRVSFAQSADAKKPFATISMENFKNMGYEGSFWIGSPSQNMQVIYDTGSAWAWVFSSEECKDMCPARNPKFFETRSETFKQNPKGGQFFQYGKGAVLGHPAEDRGCFGENQECIEGFNFLNVVKGKDLEALNGAGLIGLAPIPSKKKELEDAFDHGIPGFVAQLKHNSEFVDARGHQFSIYLSNDESSPGALSFGGYDLAQYAAAGSTD